jgi:hypothetical protein
MVTLAIVLLTGMAGLPQRAVADELVLIGAGDIANCSSNADERLPEWQRKELDRLLGAELGDD